MPGETAAGPFRIAEIVTQYRDLPYLIDPEQELCYGAFFARVMEVRNRLLRNGIHPGDHVAVLAPNGWQYVMLLWALWESGAVAVPLSTRHPVKQLLRLISDTGCSTVVISEEFSRTLPPATRLLRLNDLVAPASNHIAGQLPSIDPAAPATIIFTSGSSGEPRGALHTFGNHLYSALGSNQNIAFGPGQRWLVSLPLYHVGGLAILFRAAVAGGTVALPSAGTGLPAAIAQLKVTHLSLVATQFYRLLNDPDGGKIWPQLRAILLGGSAIPPALIEQGHRLGLPVHSSYGATEMSSQITTTPVGASLPHLRSSGRILPYRELKIAPDGEILVRGQTLFCGYWRNGNLNPQRTADGWFATGDLGHLDPEGFLFVTGRKDNRFISGGENIQAEEVEAAISRFPGVLQVMVVPVSHGEYGQRPVAFVQMDDGGAPPEKDLRTALETELPRFKIPDYFFPWPQKIPGGGIKPGRNWLRQLAEQILTN